MKTSTLILIAVAVFAVFAFFRFLPKRELAPQSPGMKTLSKPARRAKPALKLSVRKSAKLRQTRAEFVSEVKAICARIDAGTERMYSSEEVKRELGI